MISKDQPTLEEIKFNHKFLVESEADCTPGAGQQNPTHVLRMRIKTLFNAIKHGDEEHQKWLREAIDKHFEGLV